MRLTLDPSLDPADYGFAHDIRVRYAEVDTMGVVHHAAYLPYLEEARVAFVRALGERAGSAASYEDVRARGIDLAILEAFVAYRRPLRFAEVVRIHVRPGAFTTATFQIAHLLTVGEEVRATAVTVHGCLTPSGRPTLVPGWLRALAED